MSVSVRSYLTAGISVVAAGMIAIPPSVPPHPPSSRVTQVAQPVELAASVRPLIIEPPSPQKFAAAVAAIEKIDPSARDAAQQAVTPAAVPAPLNAASDLIVSGYQFVRYWVNYGVQLANYVLNFVPYGYLIASQINIFYYNLIQPIADSVVYQLIVPVVNDPLNPASYVNGLINVGQTAINATINTGIAQFNYFFGWLIPPLPPLPFAAVAKSVPTVEEDLATPLAATQESTTETVDPTTVVDKHQVETSTSTAVPTATEASTKVEDTKVETPVVEAPEPAKLKTTPLETTPLETTPLETTKTETTKTETTTSANGVQAQGEVRGGTTVKDDTMDPDTKPADNKPADTKPADTKPIEAKTPDLKTPETKTDPKDDAAKG